jgi:transcriptional pleiotropic regulator of transition state genes
LTTTGVYWIQKKRRKGREKMKATGIVRKVDELGRVVLPVELRKTFDIKKEDPLEIYVDGDSIILKKYEPACIFCGDAKNVRRIHEKVVCANCLEEMKSL